MCFISQCSIIWEYFKWLCEFDRNATIFLARLSMDSANSHQAFRRFMKLLEWSVHGYGWFTFLGYCVCTTKKIRNLPFYLNTLIGDLICKFLRCTYFHSFNLFWTALVFDMIVIGSIKVAFRRPRPVHNRNDMVGMIPFVDDFSFPSMHSSRSAMITKILIHVLRLNPKVAKFAFLYPVLMALSRVILGRHYLSDVMVGLLVGALEGHLVTSCWLSSEFCLKIIKQFRRFP